MPTENNHFNDPEETNSVSSVPSEWTEDRTLRQETIGAVGAVGATGTMGAALPGSGAYAGGAAFLGLGSAASQGHSSDSDGRLAENAEIALAEEPRLTTNAATGIRIDAAFGVLELSGAVPTEADRQVAEETVSHLPGVNAVENKLHVTAPG